VSWGFIRLPDQRAVVFSYVDPKAGPSAKGARVLGDVPSPEEVQAAVTRPNVTVRLEKGLPPRPLNDETLDQLGLPGEPAWLELFRPPPPKPRPAPALPVEEPPVDTGTALRLALIVVGVLTALAFVAFELLN
jgi:hypothetical protein